MVIYQLKKIVTRSNCFFTHSISQNPNSGIAEIVSISFGVISKRCVVYSFTNDSFEFTEIF